MQKKYKIGLLITGILLVFSLINSVLYIQYKIKTNPHSSTIVVVNNTLSVNYELGDAIDLNSENQTYNFSITNNSKEKTYYYINLSNVISNNEFIKFTLEETGGKLNISQNSFPAQDAYLANFIEIAPNTTHYYIFNIYNLNNLNLKAKINIGIEGETEEYFASTLLKNNTIQTSASSAIGEQIASDNEGLIETNDDLGTCYYFRGNIENNYVKIANMLWRIVKINGDGTIKIVLDDYLSDTQNMLTSENISQLKFIETNVYNSLNNFYQTYLRNYDKYISNSKICMDETISNINNSTTYYLGYTRALTDYNPIYNCVGSSYTSKIGLLTVDEVLFAGASKNSDNTSFYLYTSDKPTSWWTMTPALSTEENITYFSISQNGKTIYSDIDSYYRGIRPVINLIKKTIVTGDGTINNPYIIKET